MKWRNLAAIGFALPSANGLSLSNFQQITSASIPINCQLTYSNQISVCTVSDFQNGCSEKCQTALSILGVGVTTSCIGVAAGANTLLGIVMRGGIIPALCPTDDQGSTITSSSTKGTGLTTIRPSFLTTTASITKASASVTPPTSSGVAPSTTTTEAKTTATSATTKATSQSQTASSQTTASVISTSQTTTSPTSSITPPVSSTATDDDDNGGQQSTTLLTESSSRGTQVAATSTKPAAATKSKASDDGSGGGSPFDIQSAATQFGGSTAIYALIIAAWTGVVLRW